MARLKWKRERLGVAGSGHCHKLRRGDLTLATVAPAGEGRGWYFSGHVPGGEGHNSLWGQQTWPDEEEAKSAGAEWVKAEEAKVASREVSHG